MSTDLPDTRDPGYTDHLLAPSQTRLGDAKQLPYRAHIRFLQLGEMLDLGCGVGRNLAHNGGRGVGIDHNPTSVAAARDRGLVAFTPQTFAEAAYAPEAFDAILCAHVAEHLSRADFLALARDHLPYLKTGGRFVLVNPQARGYASDATHVRYVDFREQRALLEALGLRVARNYSFPFPAFAGGIFTYNEFVSIANKI